MAEEHSGKALAGIRILRELSPEARDDIARRCRWHRYGVHQQIVGYQDESTNVYLLVDGLVQVSIYSVSGKEVTFRDIGAGECFGELSAIDGQARSASVVAVRETLIATMSAGTFWEILREQPKAAEAVLKQLVGLIRMMSDRVFEYSTLAVKNRIDAEVLRLARQHMQGENKALIAPAPTHADIASRISTHREAVTRELSDLARAGIVERQRGALVVSDVARLQELVDQVMGES